MLGIRPRAASRGVIANPTTLMGGGRPHFQPCAECLIDAGPPTLSSGLFTCEEPTRKPESRKQKVTVNRSLKSFRHIKDRCETQNKDQD